MGKQAVIFGATGAVGSKLLDLCLHGDRYQLVTVLARRAATISHKKLHWMEVDYEDLADLPPIPGLASGDAYCCLGTTIKAAGSKQGFRHVDFDYALNAAILSKKSTAKSFSLISAIGADPESKSFYNRTKGEVEQAIMAQGFEALHILRPSLLKGARDEFRLKEEAGNILSSLLTPVFFFGLKKYQPIKIDTLARGLYRSADEEIPPGAVRIYESDELQTY